MVRSLALIIIYVAVIQLLYGQRNDLREAEPLENLVREALTNNPGLASFRYREEAAEQRIGQMRAWMPPMLKYQYSRQPIGSMEMVDFMTMHTYSVSQMIPFPGKLSARVDMERANHEMAEFDRDYAALQLAARVKEVYFELWMMQKKLEVNRELQLLVKDFIVTAERLYEVKMRGVEAVLSAQTNASKLQTEERMLGNEYAKMLAMFNQLLDRSPDERLGTIISLPPEEIPYDITDLEQRMLERRPDIRAMQSGIEMKQAEIRSARRQYYPDIMVDLMYMQMPGGMEDQFGGMISFQIPLAPWSGAMATKRVAEAQNDRRAREKVLENMTSMAKSEIRQAILDIETKRDVIRLYREEVIPKAEQATESVLAAYRSGTLEYLMVLDSFRTLEMYRLEYYAAQAEFHKAIAELERQAGIVLRVSGF
jgi:outer membrane protein, heavy metal efflux system